MPVSRRQLLGQLALGGAGLAAASTGLGGLVSPAAADSRSPHGRAAGRAAAALFGPLVARDGDLLALPQDFEYRVVSRSGETALLDGPGGTRIGVTPDRPDGTRTVATRSGLLLIQNHELSARDTNRVPQVPGTVYDEALTGGGCTVIETRPHGERVQEWVGLSGTISNCAGGPTPWGSWLTCEETEAKAGSGLAQDHGYVFEVFATGPDRQCPEPIRAWGRAPHEAVVVEPSRRRVYLTEDASQPTGLLYRWTAPGGVTLQPYLARQLGDHDGTLEALAVLTNDGSVLPDLAYVTAAQIGRPFRTAWRTVPDRLATDISLRKQDYSGGVTHSKKLEGAWGDDRGLYFVASFAFAADIPANATPHDGQLWFYDYREDTLTLVAYFPYNALLHDESGDWETNLGPSLDLAFDGPDGCHVSPYGDLILTEDGNTANHLLAWNSETGAQAIARNLIVEDTNSAGGHVYSEMTGPAFSPDGRVLFCNVQEPGHVFAITGPWSRYLG